MTGSHAPTRRGDIQGLRAVAILFVVTFHGVDRFLPGGFVGVDVFFVISGFLIAGILIREQSTTGSISLTSFWARRIRRLMPATLVVAIATLAVAALRLDTFSLVRTLENAGWSLISLANIHFATSPTGGYFSNPVPNPFLHFWSLSVEEQFYVVFPVLLLLVGLLTRSWAVPTIIGAVFVSSLLASIWLSATNDPMAFYSLGTRAWELAIGAGLAWFGPKGRGDRRPWVRTLAFALGLSAIVLAGCTFTASMAWPGYGALVPTMGTALIIWAGTGGSAGWVAWILDNPPMRYIGDVSFSFYLWHWPVLVLAPPKIAGGGLSLLAIVFAFGLAVLTYRFVEQPFQRPRRGVRALRVLAIGLPAAVALSATTFVFAAAAMPSTGLRVAPLPAQYQALDDGPGVVPPAVPTNVRPSLLDVGYDLQSVYRDCYGPGVPECWSGDARGQRTVLVTGDSYAGMFWPSIEQAAQVHRWRLVIVAKAGCGLFTPSPLATDASQAEIDCNTWRGKALQRATEIHPDLILYINSVPRVDESRVANWIPGMTSALQRLRQVSPILMLAPTPTFPHVSEQCLEEYFFEPTRCSRSLDEVVTPATRAAIAEIAEAEGADLLDLNGILCDAERMCPMIANDTVMYRDSGHISNAYSTHFATVIGDVLEHHIGR
jgi:peptidoglycan/LPS O-acetylase OafA/YrhL